MLLKNHISCYQEKPQNSPILKLKKEKDNHSTYFQSVFQLELTEIPTENEKINLEFLKESSLECIYPECGKKLKNKTTLRKHYIRHFKFMSYFCHFFPCNKIFKTRENLDLHIVNFHIKMKPYICNFCPKEFSHRNGKTYHERTRHLNFLPFDCKNEGKFILIDRVWKKIC